MQTRNLGVCVFQRPLLCLLITIFWWVVIGFLLENSNSFIPEWVNTLSVVYLLVFIVLTFKSINVWMYSKEAEWRERSLLTKPLPRIFLFVGDVFLREMYEETWKKYGTKVRAFSCPSKEIIEKIISEAPDVIITDFLMENMDGWTFIQELKSNSQTNNIPIIALSNLSQKEDINKAYKLGVNKYIIMAQYMPSEVLAKVQSLFLSLQKK